MAVMFSKRHYEFFADFLRLDMAGLPEEQRHFAKDNPNFKPTFFLKKAGMPAD